MIIPLTDKFWESLTPAALAAALSDHPSLFWLDSGNPCEGWSYLGIQPNFRKPLSELFSQPLQDPTHGLLPFNHRLSTPSFRGGWIVRINYPSGTLPCSFSRAMLNSETQAFFYDLILAYSHAERHWYFCSIQRGILSYKNCLRKMKSMIELYKIRAIRSELSAPLINRPCFNDRLDPAQYLRSIDDALGYIRSGDIYQVNIAHRFTALWRRSAYELFLRMRDRSPASYGVYLGAALSRDNREICCISPELFLSIRNGKIQTRPIKGTRPRGSTPVETAVVRRELESNEKECAELNMIVDLERNDLGRVCTYGSVHVVSPGEVEVLPTLLHRTATISGTLRSGTTVGEVLAATFPGGSITGAPKLRAMEIIAELEPVPRGAYCGSIGWVGIDGNLELNIAIRTAVCDTANGVAQYHAGAGIVADSVPEKEWDETLLKTAAFFDAVRD